MKKKIIEAISQLNRSYRVEKVKGCRMIRVYFSDGFVPGCLIDILQSIDGLILTGINVNGSYILFIY